MTLSKYLPYWQWGIGSNERNTAQKKPKTSTYKFSNLFLNMMFQNTLRSLTKSSEFITYSINTLLILATTHSAKIIWPIRKKSTHAIWTIKKEIIYFHNLRSFPITLLINWLPCPKRSANLVWQARCSILRREKLSYKSILIISIWSLLLKNLSLSVRKLTRCAIVKKKLQQSLTVWTQNQRKMTILIRSYWS